RPQLERRDPVLVREFLDPAGLMRTDGVDEDVELTPSLAELREGRLDLALDHDVHPEADRVGTAELAQHLDRLVERRLRATEDRDPRAVFREALGGCASHAARPSVDHGRGSAQPEFHDGPSSGDQSMVGAPSATIRENFPSWSWRRRG